MEYKIHLIRHGITEGNQKGWHYGSMDIPLAKEGLVNLRELKQEGIYPSIENCSCYTSGMLRTEQTFCELFGDISHESLAEFREMNFGDFEGKTYEQLKDEEEYKLWVEDKSGTVKIPGGESKGEFYHRVVKGLERLIENRQGKAAALCVCHGGVIASLMHRCFENEEKHFFQWIPEPGRGFTIIIDTKNIFTYDAI